MEEIDNIIIHSLRQIGCDIEENVTNLSSFNTELVVEATVRCLEAIRPGLGLSTVLPVNMAARFRLGATLAQTCMELGYRGDIGYQTFLYNSEADLRRVFMFLIEKLPKESEKTINESISKVALLEKSVASAISQGLSIPWLPHYCHKQGFRNRGRANVPYVSVNIEVPIANIEDGNAILILLGLLLLDNVNAMATVIIADYKDYCMRYLQPVPEQMQDIACFLPSMISYNAKALNTSPTDIMERINWLSSQHSEKPAYSNAYNIVKEFSKFSSENKIQTSTESQVKPESVMQPVLPDQETLRNQAKQEVETEKMKAECESLRINIEELQNEIKKLTTRLAQATITGQNEEKELKINEEQKKIKAKAYELLQDGPENVKKLESAIEASTSKLINLANQWEKHRVPLIMKYRQEREKHSTKANASQKKLDEIKLLKEKEKELQEECRNKDQQYSQLVAEVQKLPKEVNRSAYTQRILEIINNVRKQRDEINKVLADTREIQKEINTLTGRLERSFTVVDELIFRDARTNEASRKAYKLLATLHSDCNELVSLVEETGATIREIRDLEEQIDSESAKNVGANLERITADLKQMKQETAALTAQLQSKAS
ncbi:PREDICTED: coiled-coil domain-containing protein 22 homolog isoform X1 [Trachymyrmex septentrionalis]|uniref:coiled-coil domain-containing protein 22 homolog isoform X1 n=1 Tax=Trachymyrmex septentrionalis TaxID=34720 RepID=UPI00084F0187|nr:PREDICTED: coiled-coil domain-containing protein 22 homolog isoform X1 [Trachymyrmex septentrionalis]XP_018345249.1 PREDICTED: coiled-coil domain-containing protein 22 homolog isoform X1 [Trachymyrmex septentrionalis]